MVIDKIAQGGAEKVFFKLYNFFVHDYDLDIYSILKVNANWFQVKHSCKLYSAVDNSKNSKNIFGKIISQIIFLIKLFFLVKQNNYNFIFSF